MMNAKRIVTQKTPIKGKNHERQKGHQSTKDFKHGHRPLQTVDHDGRKFNKRLVKY